MQLDEMKAAWRELNQRVEQNNALLVDTRRRLQLDRAQSALRRWSWLPAIELVFGVVTVLVAGAFLARHAAAILVAPAAAIPALLIAVLGIAVFAASVRQLALVIGIDYSSAVVAMQRRMLAARRLRLRMTWWDLLIGIPLWPVFVIFALQALGNFDIYRIFSPVWLIINAVAGLVIVAVLVWIARRQSNAISRSPILSRLADEIAGGGLVTAMEQLNELSRFEQGRD